MGLVYVDAIVKSQDKEVNVRFLVDSGATYAVLRRDDERGLA